MSTSYLPVHGDLVITYCWFQKWVMPRYPLPISPPCRIRFWISVPMEEYIYHLFSRHISLMFLLFRGFVFHETANFFLCPYLQFYIWRKLPSRNGNEEVSWACHVHLFHWLALSGNIQYKRKQCYNCVITIDKIRLMIFRNFSFSFQRSSSDFFLYSISSHWLIYSIYRLS